MASSELKDLAKQIVDIANGDVKKRTKAYDTPATVTRVDGDTTYVHIPGGVQETPVKTTVGAKKGDVVQVRVANKSAWMVGNASAPPTDDTEALKATKHAVNAENASQRASIAANQAEESAKKAGEAVNNLNIRISDAETEISGVEDSITDLKTRVDDAEDDIDDTLNGLALAQNIVGTLAWITAHSRITDDETPKPGVTYYIKNPDNTFTIVADPSGKNPHAEGWYIMDEALQNYVVSHLALTDDGLYVSKDDTKWKVKITNNGVYILDEQNTPVNSMSSDGNIIGKHDGERIVISEDSFHIINNNGSEAMFVDASDSALSEQLIVKNYDISEYINISNKSYVFSEIDRMPNNKEFYINILRTTKSGGGSSYSYKFTKGSPATITTTLYGEYDFPITYNGTNVISSEIASNLEAEICGYSFYNITYTPQISISGDLYVDNIIDTFGQSNTAGNISSKVLTYSSGDNVLTKNMVLKARFSYANSASNVTLNYNNTGNIPAYYNGAPISSTNGSWGDSTAFWDGIGYIVYFYYDGVSWQEFSETTPLDIALRINLLKLDWWQVIK